MLYGRRLKARFYAKKKKKPKRKLSSFGIRMV